MEHDIDAFQGFRELFSRDVVNLDKLENGIPPGRDEELYLTPRAFLGMKRKQGIQHGMVGLPLTLVHDIHAQEIV